MNETTDNLSPRATPDQVLAAVLDVLKTFHEEWPVAMDELPARADRRLEVWAAELEVWTRNRRDVEELAFAFAIQAPRMSKAGIGAAAYVTRNKIAERAELVRRAIFDVRRSSP
jgi:hypothetical protein